MKAIPTTLSFVCLVVLAVSPSAISADNRSTPPTHGDVAYGEHDRQRMDVWCVKSDRPSPLVVFIHGGGWHGGDKSDIPPKFLHAMLDNQLSVASINYRYTSMALIPGPLHDGARAIQFLRSKSTEWNLDINRIGSYGISAGGCMALWLAYHSDLGDPRSNDAVACQSSRLAVAVGISPQTSLDPPEIVGWIGNEVLNHPMIGRAIGLKKGEDFPQLIAKWQSVLRESSPIEHVSPDDPPAMLVYPRKDPLPAATPGSAIHHAAFGMKLKERTEAVGIRCELRIEENLPALAKTPEAFLLSHLAYSSKETSP